jgi:hypothetical protein
LSLSQKLGRIRNIQLEIDELHAQIRTLLDEQESLTNVAKKECQHKKVIYTDGHIHSDPDDYDTPETHICLGCGIVESGEREYNQPYNFGRTEWHYKVLTAKPIRRFCVPGRGLRELEDYYTDLVDRQVKYSRHNGQVITGKQRDAMLEKELSKYWAHVCDRIWRMSYPARVKAVMKVGYPA